MSFPAKITSTCSTCKMCKCHFGGQNNHAAKITSSCFTWKMGILVGKIIMPLNLHLLKTSRCNFGGQNNHAAKTKFTRFNWKTSKCNFCGQDKKWRELFPMHEIRRINGGKVFQNSRNVFRIWRKLVLRSEKPNSDQNFGGKKVRNQNNCGICRILSGLPNQVSF
jgi:hypothetical protein